MTPAAILILSTSKPPYPRCWAPMLRLLRQFAPLDWPVTFAFDGPADVAPIVAAGARPLRVAPHLIPWGDVAAAGAKACDARWIIVVLEDYFSNHPWDLAGLGRVLTYLEERGEEERIGYFRVQPTPGPTRRLSPVHGDIAPGTEYRTSLQIAYWQPDYFAALAAGIPAPWHFETRVNGWPNRTHLSVTRDWKPVSFANALIKGTWQEDALLLCRAMGLGDPRA